MSSVLIRHYHATLKMNRRLLVALALGGALLNVAHATILLVGTGAAATTGLTVGVSAAGLAAGAAVVGALAVGAAAVGALARRGKREAACLPFSNPEIYFSMAANSDFLDCGRRYVCELEGTPDDQLAQEEILIRNLFGRSTSATSGPAGGYFVEAGAIGAQNGSAACAQAYSTCPFDRKDIFLAFRNMQNAS